MKRVEREFTAPRTRCVHVCSLDRASEQLELILCSAPQDISPEIRLAITRVSLLLSLFAKYCIPISVDLIVEAYETSVRLVGEDAAGVRRLARQEVGEEVLKALALGRE